MYLMGGTSGLSRDGASSAMSAILVAVKGFLRRIRVNARCARMNLGAYGNTLCGYLVVVGRLEDLYDLSCMADDKLTSVGGRSGTALKCFLKLASSRSGL